MEGLKCASCGAPLTGEGDVKCSQCKADMTCTAETCTCAADGNTIKPEEVKCVACLGIA